MNDFELSFAGLITYGNRLYGSKASVFVDKGKSYGRWLVKSIYGVVLVKGKLWGSRVQYGLHPHPPILEDYLNVLGVLYKVENYKGN